MSGFNAPFTLTTSSSSASSDHVEVHKVNKDKNHYLKAYLECHEKRKGKFERTAKRAHPFAQKIQWILTYLNNYEKRFTTPKAEVRRQEKGSKKWSKPPCSTNGQENIRIEIGLRNVSRCQKVVKIWQNGLKIHLQALQECQVADKGAVLWTKRPYYSHKIPRNVKACVRYQSYPRKSSNVGTNSLCQWDACKRSQQWHMRIWPDLLNCCFSVQRWQ